MPCDPLAPRPAAALRRRLLAWYDAHGRALPWRERRSTYGAWIAEMMLQQTTVAAAAPYWERFLARFPDVAALAAASEPEVLAAWAGLGYYRRARDLHAAARTIVARDGGRLPDSFPGWLALPGIGRYTAGALASIAGGERVPAVDANARRVLLRWLCDSPEAAAGVGPRRLEAAAAALVPADRPGDWNQALMDLATAVCRPVAPLCDACPAAPWCRARAAGAADRVPAPPPRRQPSRVRLGLLVVQCGRGLLLLPPGAPPQVGPPSGASVRRRDFRALTRGLWGLPSSPWCAVAGPDADAARFGRELAAGWTVWLTAAGARAARVEALAGRFRHAITTFDLEVVVARAELAGPGSAGAWPPDAVWWQPDEPAPPLSGLARKALQVAGRAPA
ncbi:MAG: A/G-specific adenine glycosylase [Candidatus Krumholzibacteriia bacterium]